MKITKQILLFPLTLTLLAGCNGNSGKSFYLSFYQDEGNQLDTMQCFVGKTTQAEVDTFVDGIKINEKIGYDVSWPEFDVTTLTTDTEYQAIYDYHNYVISFVYEGSVIATTTYTIATKFVETPYMPAPEEGYIYQAEEYDFRNKHEDFEVNCTKIERPYVMTFMKDEDDIDPVVITYTITSPTVEVPAGEEGYTTTWKCGEFEFEAGETVDMTGRVGDYTFLRNAVANKYTITYVTSSGEQTQEVTYGQEYELIPVSSPSTSYEAIAWIDESGKEFPMSGTWTYGADVTLHAQWGLSFEGDTLPIALDQTKSQNVKFEIFNRNSTSGNKCLKATALADGKFTIDLVSDFFTDMFADANVKEIVFDATSNKDYSTFASRYYGDTGTSLGTRVANFTYETAGVETAGVLSEGWKTFRFKRDYLNQLEDFIIIQSIKAGDFILLDNIHPITEEFNTSVIGFENGYYTGSDGKGNLVFYDDGHAATKGHCIFNVRDESDYQYLGYDYDIKSEGNRSIKFTKGSGNQNYAAIYCHTYIRNLVGPGGYLSFDLYTSITLNAFSIKDGRSYPDNIWSSSVQHPKNTWKTYTVPYEYMTTDGRMIQIYGSTSGDYYFDNFVPHPAVTE